MVQGGAALRGDDRTAFGEQGVGDAVGEPLDGVGLCSCGAEPDDGRRRGGGDGERDAWEGTCHESVSGRVQGETCSCGPHRSRRASGT
nr:hypothetical protein GCM10017745_48770 [Saccharothrix mutabilis subsp. capreolus]